MVMYGHGTAYIASKKCVIMVQLGAIITQNRFVLTTHSCNIDFRQQHSHMHNRARLTIPTTALSIYKNNVRISVNRLALVANTLVLNINKTLFMSSPFLPASSFSFPVHFVCMLQSKCAIFSRCSCCRRKDY